MVAPSSRPCSTNRWIFCSWAGATIAPMSIALSSGSPTRSLSIRARSFSISRAATPSCTSRREPAQQTWPWLNQIASTTPSTTLSKSASSNTTNGDLPPSSSEIFLPLPAVAWRMIRPTSVDPVKAILSIPACLTIISPTAPSPVMILITPGGRPTSSQICANASAVSEVHSAGFSTTVLPIARAGVAGCLRPAFERAARRGNGAVDICLARLGHAGDRFAVGWVDALKQAIVGGRGPRAVDVHAEAALVRVEPGVGRRGALGGGAVFHRFEYLCYLGSHIAPL